MLAYRGFEDTAGYHLCRIAKLEEVQEIIVGIRNRSRLGKLLLGSVAQSVILQADCSVICVKKKM